MTIQLTREGLRNIFPNAPRDIIEERVPDWQRALDRAGVTHTRTRLSYFFANIEHECGGFTIKNLTENTNYSVKRAAEIFPTRAGRTAAEVAANFGDPIDRRPFFNLMYGTRMGNRPGTDDGWNYIGRGGPQWTGRDGYAELERRTGVPAIDHPEMAAAHHNQPEVCVAFWDWKQLNAKADVGDFKGVVKLWNGGTNGMADRLAQLEGNDPIIARLEIVDRVLPEAKKLPGNPPTKLPPKDVIDATTVNERKTRKGGAAGAAIGGGNEGAKQTGSVQPDKMPPAELGYGLIAAGVVVFIVASFLIWRKKRAVIANWF